MDARGSVSQKERSGHACGVLQSRVASVHTVRAVRKNALQYINWGVGATNSSIRFQNTLAMEIFSFTYRSMLEGGIFACLIGTLWNCLN